MQKKYRPNAAVLITDGNGRVLLCERLEPVRQVQTVQGGIDPGETAREAAVRELWEEVGLTPDQFDLVGEVPGTFRYDWPEEYRAQLKDPGAYDGQEQTVFLAKTHPDVVFDLETHNKEFSRVWWGTPEEMIEKSWSAKRSILEAALRHFALLSE
ncbi:NUDIX domain-containing protein [Candidatus Uhrbacteria bacterium]|nr:NUDIX domain-containing protein [Candidatus Uhrbacteria bacterium]